MHLKRKNSQLRDKSFLERPKRSNSDSVEKVVSRELKLEGIDTNIKINSLL